MFTSFHQNWLRGFDLAPPPMEAKINCRACVMVNPPQNETLRDSGPFDANVKCCAYTPFVPNFALGKILLESDVDVFAALRGRVRVTPLGLIPLGNESTSPSQAHESEACGFLNAASGLCNIWESRPAVCASYHCVSVRARAGLDYWKKIEELGNQIEWTLAHEALWRMGFTIAETDQMATSDSWFEWAGREAELYERSFDLAQEISGHELRKALGGEGEALLLEIRALARG